jgi:acetolactate synthase-1/3 small subunit
MEQIITGQVENHPGVLAQIADQFRKMNVNISSVAVAETEDENFSYITLVTEAEVSVDELRENLSKIIEIHDLQELGQGDYYERELVLVKIALEADQLSHIMQIAEVFRAHVVGVSKKSITLEFTGEAEQVKGFILMLEPFDIRGVARTGRTALKKDE